MIELVQIDELTRELDSERSGNAPPQVTDEAANDRPDCHHEHEPPQRVGPVLETVVQIRYSTRVEKRYPAPRTVCTMRSYPNSSSALRRRRMCTSIVRSST